jgi:fibronectin type 3 domain-containing protein
MQVIANVDSLDGEPIKNYIWKLDNIPLTYNNKPAFALPTGSLAAGVHQLSLQVKDEKGNLSTPLTRSFIVDDTRPTIPVVTDQGATVLFGATELSASWASSDPETGIVEYQYKITQDSTTGYVIKDWTSVGTSTSVKAADLVLIGNTTYYFGVRAKNGAGIWSFPGYSDGIRVVLPPAAPQNLTATLASTTQVNLSWSAGGGETSGYRILRKLGETGTYALIQALTAGSTSYSDTGVSAGNIYYYKVRAYNAYGNSGFSNEARAALVPPNPPSGLSAQPHEQQPANYISLTWSDNSLDETGFKLQRKTGISGTYALIATLPAGTTAYIDSGLIPGTAYYYRVRSVNIIGNSSFSNEAQATTSQIPPAAPASLTVAAEYLNYAGSRYFYRMNLRWIDNSNNESGFIIERARSASGPFTQVATVAANTTWCPDQPIWAVGYTYCYRVRSYNEAGNSAYTNTACITNTGN